MAIVACEHHTGMGLCAECQRTHWYGGGTAAEHEARGRRRALERPSAQRVREAVEVLRFFGWSGEADRLLESARFSGIL